MKEIWVVVYSGLCNRLFSICSAMRISQKYGHVVTVFWPQRTGRFGLPYTGPTMTSTWDTYFERIKSIHTIPIEKSIAFPKEFEIAFDDASIYPENIPGTGNVQVNLTEAQRMYVFSAKTIDAKNTQKIIVQKITKPYGSTDDNMEPYKEYFNKVGFRYTKTDHPYLQELSDQLKKFKPKNMKQIEALWKKFPQDHEIWGIHIRGTDLHSDLKQNPIKTASIKKILSYVEEYNINVINCKKISIYLSTDDKDFIDNNLRVKFYKNTTIITNDEPNKYENSVEGVKHSIVDLWGYKKCSKIFGTENSSYSMIAWLLSNSEDYYIHS